MERGIKERGGQERARERRSRRETAGTERDRQGGNEVVCPVSLPLLDI